MKPIVVAAGALLVGVLWNNPAGGMVLGQSLWRKHEPQRGRNQPHQRLRWQYEPLLRPGHRTHEHVRWQQRARVRRWNGTYQRLWRQHVRRLWSGRHAYLFVWGRSDLSPARLRGGYAGYPAYHPPVAVPYYSASGCNGCAAAAGAIVGATAGVAAGAAVAGAAAPPPRIMPQRRSRMQRCRPVASYRPFPHEYDCGGMWLAAAYGANGVYYSVVPRP